MIKQYQKYLSTLDETGEEKFNTAGTLNDVKADVKKVEKGAKLEEVFAN